MRDILKNIICLLIINIIASIGSFAIILLVIAMFEPSDNIISKIFYNFSFQIIFLIVIGRLLILPFAYKKLENSANYKLVSKFIHKLKQSNYLKLIVLVIAYNCIFYILAIGLSMVQQWFLRAIDSECIVRLSRKLSCIIYILVY